MTHQISSDITAGANPSLNAFRDAQHAQDAWTAEAVDTSSTTVSMWIDTLPPSSPLRASIVTAPTPPPCPLQAPAFFNVDVRSTYTHPFGLAPELSITRKSSDVIQSGIECDTVHVGREDIGLEKADSGVGEECGDVGGLEPDMEDPVVINEPLEAMATEERLAWRK
jgi:hypothetical protein